MSILSLARLTARGQSDKSALLLMLSAAEARRLRESLPPAFARAFDRLAAEALSAGPWSVTYKRPAAGVTSAGPHDYFSEGPYWWPDPKNPNGPYIRHDGRRNPARFTGNHADLDSLSAAVLALGLGAFFLKKLECAAHASRILSVWFVEPATRMNPNLEHGQAIRGINDGRGTGLIDVNSLIHVVQGLALLDATGAIEKDVANGVRQWMTEFLRWMTTSSKGLAERTSGNNHATWWGAKVAAFASYLGDEPSLRMSFDYYRSYLVPSEIRPDGSCPREEARTNSLSYSCFNLDAFSIICRIGQLHGVDLWRFRAPKGGSVAKACAYVRPFVLHPETWPHEQISSFRPDSYIFPALAGKGIPSADLSDMYTRLPHASGAWNRLIDLLVNAPD